MAIFETGKGLVRTGQNYWRQHFTFTIVVSEDDPLYAEVFDWLFSIAPNEKHRALVVGSSRTPSRGPIGDTTSESDTSRLYIRFDEGTSKSVELEGHTIEIAVIQPEFNEKAMMYGKMTTKIQFIMKSHAAQKALLRQLEKLNAGRTKSRKAVLRMVNAWNQWVIRSDLPPRTMDSVALPVNQKKRIVDDLKDFLDAEEHYNRLAIPWHRGYMFYGPAGTGKTSLIKALANEFNLDLWYISLSDLKAEAGLLGLLAEVGPRSLLLLEDIDTVQITQDRDAAEQGKISLSSLLNTLDGVATPHGMITMMTTNRFEVLDSALTRAGRMDLVEELSYPTVGTIEQMYKHFYGVVPKWSFRRKSTVIDGLSTAQIAEVMKRNMNSKSAALKAITSLIEENWSEPV